MYQSSENRRVAVFEISPARIMLQWVIFVLESQKADPRGEQKTKNKRFKVNRGCQDIITTGVTVSRRISFMMYTTIMIISSALSVSVSQESPS